MSLTLLALLLLLIAGVVLLGWAWRGRRVDDHPVCRKCRFDLYGLPEPEACPECGAALGGAGAVRIGNRRRHTEPGGG